MLMLLLYALGAGAAASRTRRRSDRSRTARHARRPGRSFRGRPHRVALELAGETEFAQLVAHHVFRDVHRNKLLAVVHRDGVTHHLRNDGRAPRPGAQHLLLIARVHAVHPRLQVAIHERTLLG